MGWKENKTAYNKKYQAEKLKQVSFALRWSGDGLTYPRLKSAADQAGESVSGYMKTAIMQRMDRDGVQIEGGAAGL